VPKLLLDDVFEQKDDIAHTVAEELGKVRLTKVPSHSLAWIWC
jgi:hypothetical protein